MKPTPEVQEAERQRRDKKEERERVQEDPAQLKIRELTAEVAALQAFKDYVHKRLDDAGVPTHPDGLHSAAGCRIGDRLDFVLPAVDAPPRELGAVEMGIRDEIARLLDKSAKAAGHLSGYYEAMSQDAARGRFDDNLAHYRRVAIETHGNITQIVDDLEAFPDDTPTLGPNLGLIG